MEKRVVFRSAWLPYALVAPQIAITIISIQRAQFSRRPMSHNRQ